MLFLICNQFSLYHQITAFIAFSWQPISKKVDTHINLATKKIPKFGPRLVAD